MSRIELLPKTPTDPQLEEMFNEVLGRWPRVPNLYRTLGHSPDMLRGWLDIAWTLRLKAKTPRRVRELIILEGARVSRSGYEWAQHVPMALEAGVTQAEVDSILSGNWSGTLSAAERAALQMAREVTEGPAASEACITELKAYYSDPEVIELVLTATFYVCVARTLMSLDVPLEAEYDEPPF